MRIYFKCLKNIFSNCHHQYFILIIIVYKLHFILYMNHNINSTKTAHYILNSLGYAILFIHTSIFWLWILLIWFVVIVSERIACKKLQFVKHINLIRILYFTYLHIRFCVSHFQIHLLHHIDGLET